MAGAAKNRQKTAIKRPLIESIFLRHSPENLHAAVIPVGEGDVVVLRNLLQQARPFLLRLIRHAEDHGCLGFLGIGRIDDFLHANGKACVRVRGWRCGRGRCHGVFLSVLYGHTVFNCYDFRNCLKFRRFVWQRFQRGD